MKRLTKSQYEAIALRLGLGLRRANANKATLLSIEEALVTLFYQTDTQFHPANFYVDLMKARYGDNWSAIED